MSNLGLYQTTTTVMKKMGGPGVLGIAVGIGGYVVIRVGEGIVKLVIRGVKAAKAANKDKTREYQVEHYGIDDQGLELKPKETVRILEQDGDAVLIEKVGSDHNPFFVSSEFLKKTLGTQFC